MKTQYIHNMTRFNIWNNFLSYKYLTHFLWTKRYVSTNASVTGFHHFSLYVTELTHQKAQRVQFWSFTVALNVLRYKLWSILIKLTCKAWRKREHWSVTLGTVIMGVLLGELVSQTLQSKTQFIMDTKQGAYGRSKIHPTICFWRSKVQYRCVREMRPQG